MGKKRSRRRLRRRRRTPWSFRLVLILLPFLLLAALEGVLRLGGVAREESLFLERRLGNRTFLQTNPEIGKRFFPPSVASVMPRANFQVLPKEKPLGTKRILCIGESSTAGFPFPVHGSFPALLDQILEERGPEMAWEVTNCGLTAISSASVVELMDELLATDLDVMVLYLGHNEFYGAGGVASQRGDLGRVIAFARRLRLVRLIEPLVSRSDQRAEPGTLMERMVRSANLAPDAPERATAAQRFAAHLEQILNQALSRGVRVVLCEVVSNERDLYPLGSAGVLGTSLGGTGLAVAGWPPEGPSAEAAQQILPRLEEEVGRDSLHAGLAYLRGKARLALDRPGAAEDLRRARNLDAVPFRAPDAINGVIRSSGKREGIVFVPTDSIFRAAAASGIPGHESFVEHLHPGLLGNARLASAIADAILQRPLVDVAAEDAARWLLGSGLSRIDLSFADARIGQLLGRWPYERAGEDAPPFPYVARSVREEAVGLLIAAGDSTSAAYFGRPDPGERELISDLLRHRTDILLAHKRLAAAATARSELARAVRDLDAAAHLFAVDPALWTELGRLRLQLGDSGGAARAAHQALYWSPESADAQELLRLAEGGEGSEGTE